MADEPIDCAGTHYVSVLCSVGCGAHVVAAADFTGSAMCLECRREAEGIQWAAAAPLGDWHPTEGYPRPIEWLSERAKPAPSVGHEWRWGCVDCLANGRADNPGHANALIRMHRTYACPAVATGVERLEWQALHGDLFRRSGAGKCPPVAFDERAIRVARRADLTRRYPDQAPAWPPTRGDQP